MGVSDTRARPIGCSGAGGRGLARVGVSGPPQATSGPVWARPAGTRARLWHPGAAPRGSGFGVRGSARAPRARSRPEAPRRAGQREPRPGRARGGAGRGRGRDRPEPTWTAGPAPEPRTGWGAPGPPACAAVTSHRLSPPGPGNLWPLPALPPWPASLCFASESFSRWPPGRRGCRLRPAGRRASPPGTHLSDASPGPPRPACSMGLCGLGLLGDNLGKMLGRARRAPLWRPPVGPPKPDLAPGGPPGPRPAPLPPRSVGDP